MTFFVIVTTHTLSAFQLIVSPVFFVNSAAKKLYFHQGVTPIDGVTRGGSSSPH